METEKINKAANILFNSRLEINSLEALPDDCIPQNNEEAYNIQDVLANLYFIKTKSKIIGKKIGCTNKAAQLQININKPFYGNIFSNFSSQTNCLLDINKFINPYLEPEFSFKLKNEIDLIQAPFSLHQIYGFIESVIPSIEIVDSRFKDWTTIGINNLIADNGANAYWIRGNEYKNLDNINFTDHTVKVYINEYLIETGNSKNVLNNPVNSIKWLVNTLAKQKKYIPKAAYISTGTCTRAIPLNKKDIVMVDFDCLGIVEFQIK